MPETELDAAAIYFSQRFVKTSALLCDFCWNALPKAACFSTDFLGRLEGKGDLDLPLFNSRVGLDEIQKSSRVGRGLPAVDRSSSCRIERLLEVDMPTNDGRYPIQDTALSVGNMNEERIIEPFSPAWQLTIENDRSLTIKESSYIGQVDSIHMPIVAQVRGIMQ